ncbi:F-box protein [Legionella cincinnatiensis]|uniref:SidC homolog n=1 Tax=Legionella cincinnatiensis TaxID=28085 RepID=A0A378INR4_9GAMM|nr:F-box protein [Legionella cincinnatiensis]STX36111.1 SidC homolog [Legionella cincinnatiensis]
MHDKFEHFNQLLNVIKGEITKFLPTKEFINLSMTSKSNHNLFRTNQYLAPLQEARKFLHHVVRGNHEAVVEMLKKNPALMHIRGQVTDLSGRKFTHISGFEYAMWALDKHMWTQMLDCLPETKEGEHIKAKLRTQYQRIKEVGVTYELHGVITQTPEKHFDFEGTIIKELQEYVDKDDDNQWRTGVGSAQKLLPIHVVYEYCSDTPFYPVPDFKEQPKSSTEFYNWLNNGEKESWFCGESKLGIDFAICKGQAGAHAGSGGRGSWRAGDLNAVTALYEVRTKDFLALENDLKPCYLSEHQYKN